MFLPTIISRIFEPFVLLMVLFLWTAYRSGLFGWDMVRVVVPLLVILIVFPGLILLWSIRTKRISNWDISNRTQRVRALLVYSVFLVLSYVYLIVWGTQLLVQFFLFFLLYFFGFFLITLFSKISGHMGVATLVILFFISWYGPIAWPLITIIPILAWSRLVLKRHTLGEVIGGVLYSLVMFFLARGLLLI